MNTIRYLRIKKWLNNYGIPYCKINDDHTIDVEAGVMIEGRNITEFPDYIQFGIVRGNFCCSYNGLTSLKGSPKQVDGDFKCNYNNLTSLDGAPRMVRGHFNCRNNDLTTLRGIPEIIRKSCVLTGNKKITNFEHKPKKLGGDLYSTKNLVIDDWKEIVKGKIL